jgi:DDE superfamily endonuclease
MLTWPQECAILMTTFAPRCTKRVWPPAQRLLVGALLAPGKRTVTAALRGRGLAHAPSFQPSQRGLTRAVWSGREGARLVLLLLVSRLAPSGPLRLGLDATLARRRGAKSRAHGLDRQPGRSAHRPLVKARG